LAGIESLRSQPIGLLLEARTTFAEDDRVAKVIGYMRETGEHEIFVRRERRVAGLTARDLLAVSDPRNTKLGGLLYGLPEVGTSDTMAEAARLMMDYKLWAVPEFRLKDDLRVVTADSALKAMSDCPDLPGRASEVMTPNPGFVEFDDTVLKARSLMIKRNLDHLLVMKAGRLQGVLTSADVLLNLLPEERVPARANAEARFDYPVSRIVRPPILEVEPSEKCRDVFSAMLGKESSYAVVRLWDEVQGIITYSDAMRPLLSTRRKPVPFYIVGAPLEPFEAEAAKMKLERLGNALVKAIPSIREIRAVVKSRESGAGRRRYEVSFDVYGPGLLQAYVEEGYDLSEIFDRVGPRLKRILSAKQSKVTRSAGDTLRKGSPE